jgi:TrmH family RNA methyltransferase
MDIISSTKNQYVKEARSLHEKKFRDKTGLFLVEGTNLLKDLPDSVAVEYVFCIEDRLSELEKIFSCTRARVYITSQQVMDFISDTVSPFGIAAVCRKPSEPMRPPSGNALLLDGVSDPGNLGTILRTAASAGFDDVYLLKTADVFSPKTVRATLGALFKTRIYIIDEEQAVGIVKNCNSAVLDMDGEDFKKADLNTPVLLIAGSEAHGVSDILRRNAKHAVALKMKNGVESLNVAVAAAVAMYRFV